MRIFNTKVFDDVISGTTTWLTPAEFDAHLGQADSLAFQAVTEGVQGISPTLTVWSEHSADGQNWVATGSFVFQDQSIQEGLSYQGSYTPFGTVPPLAAHVRLRISLGNTSPKCRLKLYATGRNWPL